MSNPERKKIPEAPTPAAAPGSGNLLSSIAPPVELPNFVTTPIPQSQLPPAAAPAPVQPMLVQPVAASVPDAVETFTPEIPLSKGMPVQSVRSLDDSQATTQSPGSLTDSPTEAEKLGDVMPGSGLLTWVKGAVASGGLLQRVAERARSSVDSVITTLDPQMKDYLNSGGDLYLVVASDKEVKVSPVRDAFHAVFGKATVQFWKATNKLNTNPSLPVSVDGVTDPKAIADLFRGHFKVQSPIDVTSQGLSADTHTADGPLQTQFTSKEVATIVRFMSRGKSPGQDGLSIEHLKYGGEHVSRVLSLFYNSCLGHSYLPREMMETIVVPITKNRTGDISDRNNYRPISLATIIAKVFDGLLDARLSAHLQLNDAQFGFRPGLSTESAVLGLKHTVKYYTDRKTNVYACFLDLSKAFDLVSYNVLWEKCRKSNLPMELVNIFQYWYDHQSNKVRWGDVYSDEYGLECGVRQGGITSPKLFNLYMDELIGELSSMHAGCYVDGKSCNNFSYADDMVLLSPSTGGLVKLLGACEQYAEKHGLKYNVTKSEIMIFKTENKLPQEIPSFLLCKNQLNRVTRFKYLGHIVTDDLKDDEDIERERRALAVRANMLARRFARCTKEVKVTLFRAYCQSFYTCSLWVNYTQRAINSLRVQYNNAFRMLLGLPRHCSASGMFAEARVDGFHAIVRKRTASLLSRVRGSTNNILAVIAGRLDGPILKHWVSVIIGTLTVCGNGFPAQSDVTAAQPVGYAAAYAAAKQRIAHIRSTHSSLTNNVPIVAIEGFLQEAVNDSDVTAVQPVGYAAAYAAAKQRIAHIRSTHSSLTNNVPIVAVEGFLQEAVNDRWYDISLIVLSQPSLDIELQVQSQGTPVPAAAVAAARAGSAAGSAHGDTGFDVTIGSIMADSLKVPHTEWQEASTGVSRRELLMLAARSVAGSYRRLLAISAAEP
ncbi:unnamed protein product [Plutella xylostella]|uniref:(diamondback moth) hypothetical protein n=1 Tax=Plutella xylostella TaxID=51655 RepID=A0A8S4FZ82_PLUXY|nr:unnamed protein product [Plutella xylostella]